jgi:hypothetical protein
MFTPTTDYNQQLFAYLQTWQQLLEQWAALAAAIPFPTPPSAWPTVPFMPAGGQFMPPFMPPMPPVVPPTPTAPAPPMPPAPADYTQQLFRYLQAWRQYLEQMAGAGSGPPQAPTTQRPGAENRPADDNGKAGPPWPPSDDTGSKTIPRGDVSKGSNPPWPPPQSDIQPQSPGGSQVVSSDFGRATPLLNLPPTSGEYVTELRRPGSDLPGTFGSGPEETQLLNPPDYAFGYRGRPSAGTLPAGAVVYAAEPGASPHTSEAAAQLPAASPFSAVMDRVDLNALPQVEQRSLFSSPRAQTASERLGEAGQKPSP